MPFTSEYEYGYLCQSDDEESEFDYQILNQTEPEHPPCEFHQHIILPSDTLQGICLQYRIKPTKLRQLNRFSGSNLNLAPKKLLIPKLQNGAKVRVQDRSTKEFKIHFVMATYEFMNLKEAKCYLDIFEWDLDEALKGIEDDLGWESVNGITGPIRRRTFRENICASHDDFKRSEEEKGYDEKEQLLEVAVGLPLGVNHYVWKEFGIEMKDLSRLVDSRLFYGNPTIAPIPS
jgi:hypothetical protein